MAMTRMASLIHNNYEKIIDDIFWLSQKWILRFNVKLNKITDKYGRVNFHKEVAYDRGSNTYVNINRSYDYYFTIENIYRNDDGSKTSVFIPSIKFYMFKQRLNMALQWFISDEFNNLFVKKDGKIIIQAMVNKLDIQMGEASLIELLPAIYELENGDQIIGLNMYINKYDVIFIDVNRFMALVDLVNMINPLLTAQIMINYLGRPEPGTNLYDMGSLRPDPNTVDNSSINIPKKKDSGLGFFDRINKQKKVE